MTVSWAKEEKEKESKMHARRVEELCTEVYRTIFEMLDGEVDLEGYEAGQIATITEQAFRKACLADTPPDQSWMLPKS